MLARALLAALLLLGVSAQTATVASAQGGGAGLSDLEQALSTTAPQAGGGAESDDAAPPAIQAPTTPAGAAPATTPVQGTTPGPPAYLEPGQSAGVQPISAVATLRDPELPREPARIAAMVAVLLAALLLGLATALRATGIRTGVDVRAPSSSAPDGRLGAVRHRGGRLADDLRDFLRRSR